MNKVLIIDDDPKICLFFEILLEEMECSIEKAHRIRTAKELLISTDFDLILLDLELPDGNGIELIPELVNSSSSPEIIIITGTGDIRGAEIAFKYGAWDYVQKPFKMNEVSLSIKRALKYRREKLSTQKIVPLLRSEIIGESPAIMKCLKDIGRAASSDASVVVTGETGSGKELFSRAIHNNSRRASKPFIAIDCCALPESLIESVLFGHEKGAFTGADQKQEGLIVQANGGTLMLDEVGNMPVSVQKTFLRTLQERTVRPLGSKKEIPIDIRLISATNEDLDKSVEKKLFREDLLYRIRAMEIHLPPLRERSGDIEEIIYKKVNELTKQYHLTPKAISSEFVETLQKNKWPGNIRELINVLEVAIASASNEPTLVPKHIPAVYRVQGLNFEDEKTPEDLSEDIENLPTLSHFKDKYEKCYLEKLLKKAGGDRIKACLISDISQATLYSLLRKHGLPGFSSQS